MISSLSKYTFIMYLAFKSWAAAIQPRSWNSKIDAYFPFFLTQKVHTHAHTRTHPSLENEPLPPRSLPPVLLPLYSFFLLWIWLDCRNTSLVYKTHCSLCFILSDCLILRKLENIQAVLWPQWHPSDQWPAPGRLALGLSTCQLGWMICKHIAWVRAKKRQIYRSYLTVFKHFLPYSPSRAS